MARRMSNLEIHQVKLLICEGFSQIDVARAVGVSGAQVNRICLGDVHRDVPWPNRELGEKLMRPRGRREQQDLAQAQLTAGTPVLPEPTQIVQSTEREAIEQARQQASTREQITREIYRKVELVEKEMDADFLKEITTVQGGPDQSEPKRMPTAWEVSFLPWDEVIERAKENDIVQAATDEPDKIVQRAIGIVFHKMPEETWEAEGTLNLIRAVVKKLEETKR